ncbi:MAG: cystathionine beta-synthase, partial [Bacteroidetes bacterium SW_11_45_7]
MYYENIGDTVGNTPLVRLKRVTEDVEGTVLAKIETFNPGHSIKDRIGAKMIEAAEKNGDIEPGGTIVEGTSGNTGLGIAIAAISKGYKCIFTTNDKQSQEKIDILKAMGAEVIVCPTDVSADHPDSYYSVAHRIAEETTNAVYLDQYSNRANTEAHYEVTGPEIWRQTEGKITHLVAGVGTGGTISGIGRYLKEQNPNIKIWGIDTYGSALKKYHESGEFDWNQVYSYITEGIGEDIIPGNVDFDIIDYFEKVTDKEGALMARDLARKEGIFAGYSCGSAVAGLMHLKDHFKKDDLIVVILPDHGSRYVNKIYNDEWMLERQFIEKDLLTAKDILDSKEMREMITVDGETSLNEVLRMMKDMDISQIPVMEYDKVVGSLTEHMVLNALLENPKDKEDMVVREIMAD